LSPACSITIAYRTAVTALDHKLTIKVGMMMFLGLGLVVAVLRL
jgi:hypothetical protein